MVLKVFIIAMVVVAMIGVMVPNIFADVTFVDTFDVPSHASKVTDVTFNSDGTKMFVVGTDFDKVYEYPCSTGFDTSTCNTAGASSFDVFTADNYPQGITFNTDGTKLFVVGSTTNDVYEYPCSTGFDVSTCNAGAASVEDTTAQDTNSMDLAFNSDGTKMFVLGDAGNDVNEYTLSVGFEVSSTVNFIDSFELSGLDETNEYLKGLAFNTDGTKLFVIGITSDKVVEYPCSTGFDVSTCDGTKVSSFDVSGEEENPSGLEFNSDGTKMFVTGRTGGNVIHEYALSVGFDLSVPSEEDATKKSSSDCYDCKPPTLQESHITISSNDYVVTTGDDPIRITANVGDKVTVILNVTDNKSVQSIPFAALYTNFEERPSDMNLFYANNFDKWKHVSTSFYEWNVRVDDVPYDYDGTISWSENSPTVVTENTTEDNFIFKNDDKNMVEYFMVPFTFTINDFMEESAITAKIYDASGNRLHVTLPVTLETAGNDPINFDHVGNQKVLGFYDESVLSEMVETWSESESDAKQLSSLLGISDESLPPWTSNLATWVAEGTIDSADLIVAVEYLINQ